MSTLVRGQKTKLGEITRSTNLQVAMSSDRSDADISVFGVDSSGKLTDERYFIFYNQLSSPEGAIVASPASNGRVNVNVDLAKLPPQVQRLVFTVTGEQAGPGNTQFTLTGSDGGYATYSTAAAELSGEKALILAELYLKDEWRLAAVGQGFQGGLEALLEHFGGQSASPPPPQPPQAHPNYQPPPQTNTQYGQFTGQTTPPMPSVQTSKPNMPPGASNVSSSGSSSFQQQSTQQQRAAMSGSGMQGAESIRRSSGQTMNQGGSADVIDYHIFGDDMQLVEVELDHGESVQAEVGAMMYMGDGIKMNTGMGGDGGGIMQGLLGGLRRAISGESFFITSFVFQGQGKGHVAFAAPYPGRIVPLDLSEFGNEFFCQKDAFLCAAKGVDISVAFTKRIGAGFFGGEGFILQRLKGDGRAFIHAGGAIVQRDLKSGETLRVDTGCLVGMAPTVDYNIEFIGGFKNALFGGEGLFMATLKGPGRIYLQSLPLSRLADRLKSALRRQTGEQRGAGGSGLLGDIISGGR